jgi:cytochrome c oxidase subunit I+III
MSGGGAHVDNSVWMKAVVMGGVILTIGVILFAALSIGVAGQKQQAWDDAETAFHEVEHDYEVAKENYQLKLSEFETGNSTVTQSELDELHEAYDKAHEAEEQAHHDEIAAHLSYLTYRVSGITILLMTIAYASFIGIGGFLNASKPNADHGDGHGDGHDDHDEHHGSATPIIFAFGIFLFLAGFPNFVIACKALLSSEISADLSMMALSMVGLITIVISIANWWFEDLPFNGDGEQIATSYPFEGEHVRKVGLWVFIMSEIMVFATFFSSYLRMRTEWCTDWAIRDGVEACKDVPEGTIVTASDLLRYDFMTLLPGAINTFLLIISSYTIVLALKTAKDTNWKPSSGVMGKLMPSRKKAVRNYLIATLVLGSMFIVLKLVEWSHLVAEGFDIGTTQGSIFYIATGAHGLHVFVGLLVMLYLVFKSDTVGYDENNAQGIEYFGLYWHFVDLAWVVIFPAFYLY